MSWYRTPPRVKQYDGANPSAPRVYIACGPAVRQAAVIVVPLPKENAIQHQGYINLVRAMPCAHCNHRPRSQFCHSDMDKGLGIKTDCRRGWPGCAACHYMIGSTGTFKREHRRTLEDRYSARTRAAIVVAGKWPKRLPRWPE